MRKSITILFFFLSFGLLAQPNYNDPTKWTAKYNPQTKKPDYAVNLAYISGLISDLEVLESGYGIVSFTYNGQAAATVIVDTAVLFSLVRVMIYDYGTTTPKHTFYATAGQTNFDCSSYFDLNINYKVYVNGALNEFGHSKSGNVVIFSTGRTENDEVTITL